MINPTSGSNTVNAQGINNNGLMVGFYLGNDSHVHGFMANANSAVSGIMTDYRDHRPDHSRSPW